MPKRVYLYFSTDSRVIRSIDAARKAKETKQKTTPPQKIIEREFTFFSFSRALVR